MKESFDWVNDFLRAVEREWGENTLQNAIDLICKNLQDGLTMPTSFSGIDAPATAMAFILYGVGSKIGASYNMDGVVDNAWGVEWHRGAQT